MTTPLVLVIWYLSIALVEWAVWIWRWTGKGQSLLFVVVDSAFRGLCWPIDLFIWVRKTLGD